MSKRKRVPAQLRDLQWRHPGARRDELGAALPAVADRLIEELAAESDQQRRRFTVLRRSDLLGHAHSDVARDVGLSRSQFYRDLQEARERFGAALEGAFSVRAVTPGLLQHGVATRRVTIEALRNGGRYDEARDSATESLHAAEPAEAIELLCLRAELETECGDLADAQQTTMQARAILPQIADDRLRDLLAVTCDLADFESAHCRGTPIDPQRRKSRIAELRRHHAAGDHAYASPLVKALVAEASLLFACGDEPSALALIEEASSLVRREPSVDVRVAVDVQVRASGLHALGGDAMATALDEAARIAEAGLRWRDAHTLRLGLQSMSAHLLTVGRFDEAREYALQARSLIDLFGSPLDRVIVLSNLARIDVHRGDGTQALRWTRLARDGGCDAFPITQAIAISEAEGLALIDQPDRAVQMARASSARVRDWPRLHARAKLAEAIALAKLAPSREAESCSDEAVELSRAAGGPLVELRALDLKVKLTGDAASRRALRDLRAKLTSPQKY